MRPRRRLLLALFSLTLCACYGDAQWVSVTGQDQPPPDGTGGGSGALPACNVAAFAPLQLDTIAGQFQTDVYPLLTKADTGCVSCHARGSGRLFLVTTGA